MERARLIELVRKTGCAEEFGRYAFLCDPKWGVAERAQVAEIQAKAEAASAALTEGWLGLPTGGTSGRVRFARHDERTLSAAVAGFCQYFGLQRVNAVDVLPPFHVSGLMARVRCAETDGHHLPWDWKKLEEGKCPELPDTPDGWVLSLVPTQLQRLLDAGEVGGTVLTWLRRFRMIFVGGGPAWAHLTSVARAAGLPLVLSYGMTETAAMITALRPEEFAAGARHCGRTMPHATVEIVDEVNGGCVERGLAGLIRIKGPSLFYGYAPDARLQPWFDTEDLGFVGADGGLTIVGRRDAAIISGGKKIFPGEVEAALRATREFSDVAVIGRPHEAWGEEVVACYPGGGPSPDLRKVEEALAELPGYKRPKRYVPVAEWPRNAQGKVNRALLAKQMAG